MSAVLERPSALSSPACIVDVYPNQREWLNARKPLITASDVPAILGQGYAEQARLRVWGVKTGRIAEMEDSELLECGRVLQPGIIELFQRRTGFHTLGNLGEFTICRSAARPWLGCTLDDAFEMDDGLALVEAKNVSVFMGHDWDDEEGTSLKHQIQAQTQMACTGAVRAFIVGLIGGNKLRFVGIDRDETFIEVMMPALEEFRQFIIEDIEPPADQTEAGLKALKKLHPNDNGVTVELPAESAEWHMQLTEAKIKIKHWQSEETRVKVLLQQAIGDATYGQLPEGSRYSLKTTHRKESVVKACDYRVLRHGK